MFSKALVAGNLLMVARHQTFFLNQTI